MLHTSLHQKRKPVIHVESPLRPQAGDPGWPKPQDEDIVAGRKLALTVTADMMKAAFEANTAFAKEVCLAIVLAGGIPQAPHLLFPLFLDDFDPEQRALGLEAGIQTQRLADEVWFVLPSWRTEFSEGMQKGMERALAIPRPCIMAQTHEPYRHGDMLYASKLAYHLTRLVSGNYDLAPCSA